MSAKTQNTEYLYTILPDSYVSIGTSYTSPAVREYSSNTETTGDAPEGSFRYIFPKLVATGSSLELADMRFAEGTFPLDIERSHDTLVEMGTLLKPLSGTPSTSTTELQKRLRGADLFDCINFIMDSTAPLTSLSAKCSFLHSGLYDVDYSRYAYRCAKNISIASPFRDADCDGTQPLPRLKDSPKLSVFSMFLPTDIDGMQLSLMVRNMPIPYRKTALSKQAGGKTYAFSFPEYLIADYENSSDAQTRNSALWTDGAYVVGSMPITSAQNSATAIFYTALAGNTLLPTKDLTSPTNGWGELRGEE